jgi:hypothetical protein
MSATTRTVYREVGDVEEVCEYGDKHVVTYHETKKVTETGETREFDDGYTLNQTPLFSDAQGRVYHLRPAFDSGRAFYRRDVDHAGFEGRPGRYQGSARDLLGNPLNETTPPGPAWDDLEDIVKPNPTRRVRRKRKS